MKVAYTLFVVSIVALALAIAAKSSGSNSRAAPAAQTTKHDRDVIRFFNHHPKLQHTPAGQRALWSILDHLASTLNRQLQAANALPAHNALWECLRPHEGSDPANRDTGHNGHYGGLQMHPGWGYGTSYYASDDPWIVQKQAAEEAYKESGYSRSWLIGQWGQTIGYCWQFA